MRTDYHIDPDISRAATLPGSFYADAGIYAEQRAHVFRSSWQLVGDMGQLRVPGQVVPITLLEGCLDEPLLLTRDLEDRLHALSNVCTHRAALLCDHAEIASGLRCRYHGRRFGLDGRFLSMPEFEGAANFPSAADNLPRVSMGTCGPFVFVSLDPAVPLNALLAPFLARCGHLPLGQAAFDPARSRNYLVNCNWALYCDNYLEGFHIPFVHRGLAAVIDYGAYRTELFDWSSVQVGVAASDEAYIPLEPGSPDAGQRIAGYYFWLWPNTMLNVYPWGISVNIVKPLAVDRTRVSYLTYVWDPATLDHGAGQALDRVEREDEAVVESAQRGVRSRLYHRGRYSPTRETGVHHFHRLLAQAIPDRRP
jgi:choline monooxygenase